MLHNEGDGITHKKQERTAETMSTKKYLPFEIDTKNKTFIFSPKNYQDLFIEGTTVNEAFKAAMALGCYDGYTPILQKREENPDRNTMTQNFTEAGVEEWLTINAPEWMEKWEMAKEVRTAGNEKFPFMVRKNYFLSENPLARAFCGMNPDREYKLRPLGTFLKQAVEAKLAKKAKDQAKK